MPGLRALFDAGAPLPDGADLHFRDVLPLPLRHDYLLDITVRDIAGRLGFCHEGQRPGERASPAAEREFREKLDLLIEMGFDVKRGQRDAGLMRKKLKCSVEELRREAGRTNRSSPGWRASRTPGWSGSRG